MMQDWWGADQGSWQCPTGVPHQRPPDLFKGLLSSWSSPPLQSVVALQTQP